MPGLRVAVDVGGTFTDVCIFDEQTHATQVTKVPSTPDDPMRAVVAGIERAEVDLRRTPTTTSPGPTSVVATASRSPSGSTPRGGW